MASYLVRFSVTASVLVFSVFAHAATHHIRWEQQFGLSGQIQPILRQLNQQPGFPQLTSSDFLEVENQILANYRFVTSLQLSQGVPVKGSMIRTWESLADGHLVLMEADIEDGALVPARVANMNKRGFFAAQLKGKLSKVDSLAIAQARILKTGSDRKIVKVSGQDQWNGSDLERVITVTGRSGVHTIIYSHLTGKVKSQSYREFPEADLQAMVYPIYEETEVKRVMQQRVPVTLHNLNMYRRDIQGDPFAAAKTRRYFESMNDDLLGNTQDGQAQGYWSLNGVKQLINLIVRNLPAVPNTFENGGMLLEGKYATINLHPGVTKFTGVTVPLKPSERAMFDWQESVLNGKPDYEMSILNSYKSQPLLDANSALNRVARRLPDHDPASYINDGFDEVQVYYAIDTLMESLHTMGFTDPELSTRPFNAFLFNPDIGYRDNAYYTDDTINFTTYSPDAQNAARDNSTIWHELGHGIMDRLMGSRIRLADTGGLSEGMADFVAQIIIQDVTNNAPFEGQDEFRIKNNMGFNMTNEVHDDGESYGGSMNDLLVASIAKDGHAGLVKVADITIDAMRLARNHPALTANGWFESILFADHLGHAGVRSPDELRPLILQALAKRNFRFDNGPVAQMTVKADGAEVTSETVGSRNNPLVQHLAPGASVSHGLEISIKGSESYSFKFPVTIEVSFNDGPLQGAVKWENEAAGPRTFVLNSEADVAATKLTALSGCDLVNTEDGSCKDFVYIKVKNNGETKPVAKKRYYLRIYNDAAPAAATNGAAPKRK